MKVWTDNDAVEMMHRNTSTAFKNVAEFVSKTEMQRDDIIEYLLEISDLLDAQAQVVSLRDKLKIDKPKQ